jgi:hypothetical protein
MFAYLANEDACSNAEPPVEMTETDTQMRTHKEGNT